MQRRLAAFLVADVVGYSRLMGEDEEGTLAVLKERRASILNPVVRIHNGRVVKLMGDGALVEFRSAVDAVAAALQLQQRMSEANELQSGAKPILLRVGINFGDVLDEQGDIYGDGVNIAARLEALAEPGGICVSAKVYEELRGKLSCDFEDMGDQTVKNIERPVRAYHLRTGGGTPDITRLLVTLPFQDKPTIAVLPFANMSSDPEQQYFGEGLADDLITDLSRLPGLTVIARHSSFAHSLKTSDIHTIAKNLHARFIVEGSVRRAAARFRINAQLIDAKNQCQLWADRFDGELADVFELQDKVVARIAGALSNLISTGAPPSRRRASSIEAYDLFAHARSVVAELPISAAQARPLLEQVLALDPELAEAHAMLALCHWMSWLHFGEAREPNRTLALSAAKRAISLDPSDPCGHMVLAVTELYDFRHTEAEAAFATALRVDPNHADSWAFVSDLMTLQGRAAEAITCARHALRLNPHPPGWYYWSLGQAQYAAGHYSEAADTLRRKETYGSPSQRVLAASLAKLGQMDDARREAALFLDRNPHFTVTNWCSTQPFLDVATREHFAEGYRQSRLP